MWAVPFLIYAFALVVYLVVYAAVWLVLLTWKWLLFAAGVWLASRMARSAWQKSDARRRREHRRQLAAIDAITRDTVKEMVDIATRH